MPILAAIVSGIISVRRHLSKWAGLYHAAHSIVSEIYKFRTLAGEYDLFAAPEDGADIDGDGDRLDAGASDVGKCARDIFSIRFKGMYSAAMQQLGNDTLAHPRHLGLMSPEDGTEAHKRLLQEVRFLMTEQLYKGPELTTVDRIGGLVCQLWRWLLRQLQRLGEAAGFERGRKVKKAWAVNGNASDNAVTATFSNLSGSLAEDHRHCEHGPHHSHVQVRTARVDHYVGPMTVEQYIEHRLKPQIQHQKAYVPLMAQRLRTLDTLGILTNALGTALVAFDQDALGLKSWVALTAMLATVITSVSQHQLLQQRLSAYNGGIQNLEGILHYVSSLSIIVRRNRSTRRFCVGGVERACLDPITAWTGISGTGVSEGSDEDSKEEGESKKV